MPFCSLENAQSEAWTIKKSIDTTIMDEINGTYITLYNLTKSEIKWNSV